MCLILFSTWGLAALGFRLFFFKNHVFWFVLVTKFIFILVVMVWFCSFWSSCFGPQALFWMVLFFMMLVLMILDLNVFYSWSSSPPNFGPQGLIVLFLIDFGLCGFGSSSIFGQRSSRQPEEIALFVGLTQTKEWRSGRHNIWGIRGTGGVWCSAIGSSCTGSVPSGGEYREVPAWGWERSWGHSGYWCSPTWVKVQTQTQVLKVA